MTDIAHWETVHTSKAIDAVSWWQEPGDLWLDLIESLSLARDAPIADVGCGSSPLLAVLAERGHRDVVGVDISEAALARVRPALGDRPGVRLIAADVREFASPRPLALWHDRAVFHFLTEEQDRASYRAAMARSLGPGGHAIVAAFAADGPQTCSGLPVCRYSPQALAAALGFGADEVRRAERRIHVTPWGSTQPFSVVVVQPSR